MEVNVASTEIERINNLIRNFDWILRKQEILDDRVILTIEKKIDSAIKEPALPAGD